MKQINYFPIAGFTALYVVTVFVTAFLGFVSPYAWVFFPVVASLLGAFSYYCVALRWHQFGVGTLLTFILGTFLLAVGECDMQKALLILLAGILSDIVRGMMGSASTNGLSFAYPVLSLGVIAWILPLWTRTAWYYDGATEELGENYAKGLMQFASVWGFLLVVVATAIAGFVGIRSASKLIR